MEKIFSFTERDRTRVPIVLITENTLGVCSVQLTLEGGRERARCTMAQILLWLLSIADAWQGGPFWKTHTSTPTRVCVSLTQATLL